MLQINRPPSFIWLPYKFIAVHGSTKCSNISAQSIQSYNPNYENSSGTPHSHGGGGVHVF